MTMRLKSKFVTAACRGLLTVFAIFFSLECFSEETVEGVQKDELGYYYIIQKGDTLWGLSEKFLNSAFLWPELWKENASAVPIPNPHLIYPGQRIRLVHRDELMGGDVGATAGDGQYASYPSDDLEQPGSIAGLASPGDVKTKPTFVHFSMMDRIGFVRKTPIYDPIGSIFESKDDKQMLSAEDIVYIKQLGLTPIVLGKQYTVYRDMDILRDNESDEIIGTQYYVLGIVEIIKIEPRFSVARVVKSFRTVRIGDYIMPYERKATKIPIVGSRKDIRGKIVGSDDLETIFGQYSTCFLDKGKKHGLALGQEYTIFYQETAEINPSTRETVRLTPVEFGRLVVIHTEDTTSTALITDCERQVHLYSEFRTPIQ